MTKKERDAKIRSYGKAPSELRSALKKFPKKMWKYKPSINRWSVHEIIIHLADSEANSFVRCRRFVAEPGKTVMAYDQDVWAQKLEYHRQSTDDALALFKALRDSSYKLIRRLPDEAWSATIEHPENGTMTFERWLEVYEEHTHKHIRQMKANLEAWKKR